jgi:hypothetical protein
MPSYPRITQIPNEFFAPQSFTGSITVVVDGVSIRVRPVWQSVGSGSTRVGWEASNDNGQTWKDAGSITHGA